MRYYSALYTWSSASDMYHNLKSSTCQAMFTNILALSKQGTPFNTTMLQDFKSLLIQLYSTIKAFPTLLD